MNFPIDFAAFELLSPTEQTRPPSFAQCKPVKGIFGIKGLSRPAAAPGILLNKVLLLLHASSREGFLDPFKANCYLTKNWCCIKSYMYFILISLNSHHFSEKLLCVWYLYTGIAEDLSITL